MVRIGMAMIRWPWWIYLAIGSGSRKELCASSSAILIVARRWGVLHVSVAAVAAGWIELHLHTGPC